MSETDEEKQQRIPPALARARQLAERSQIDLRLLASATRACDLPYSDLSKVQRAQGEVSDLLRRIEAQRGKKG